MRGAALAAMLAACAHRGVPAAPPSGCFWTVNGHFPDGGTLCFDGGGGVLVARFEYDDCWDEHSCERTVTLQLDDPARAARSCRAGSCAWSSPSWTLELDGNAGTVDLHYGETYAHFVRVPR